MFKQRLLTSIILAPLVIFCIYFSNYWFLLATLLLLTLANGYEWLQLIPITKPITKFIFVGILMISIYLCFNIFNTFLLIGLVLWLIFFIAIVTFPSSQKLWGYPLIVSIMAWIFLPLFFVCLLNIYLISPNLLIYLLFLVWAADIGAYLFGKGLGKHKLIPKVSPGKTIEGTMGGLLLAIIVAIVSFFLIKPNSFIIWLIIALIITIVSIFGDLLISMLKRRCALKDTGHIIPGHGGILDRLDSLIAAAPWFYFVYITLLR